VRAASPLFAKRFVECVCPVWGPIVPSTTAVAMQSSPQGQSSDADGRTVLVVDDEASIRHLVTDILAGEGYRVQAAANGMEALDVLAERQPRLVLLDMRMPIMDGWSLAHEIRARELPVKIVVMTAAHSARLWAEEIEADGYLAKPFPLAALVKEVARHCAKP
jgi:CheY-like chemotaxis protein